MANILNGGAGDSLGALNNYVYPIGRRNKAMAFNNPGIPIRNRVQYPQFSPTAIGISQFPRQILNYNGNRATRPTYRLGSFHKFLPIGISNNTFPLNDTVGVPLNTIVGVNDDNLDTDFRGSRSLTVIPQFNVFEHANGHPVYQNYVFPRDNYANGRLREG